jgi:uncharacterized repeat protein (TIGR03803 family)
MKQKVAVVLLSELLTIVGFGFAVAVVPALAQNAVPPTARESATLPAFASRLHPHASQAASKSSASALKQRYPALPQNQVIYENGPVNGTIDAWTINFGYIVSDTFVPNGTTVTGFDIWVWEFPGDVMVSVDWSITSDPNGGTVYGSGTANGANLTDQFISTNQYGYNVDKISVSGLNLSVTSGSTYWVNLFNAVIPTGDPAYWDENSGAGCKSTGCPSQAVESAIGTIPSESFDIVGSSGPPPQECVHDVPKNDFKIIHSFTAQEQSPQGVAPDRAGNLYGSTAAGGDSGAGLVYELSPKGQDWLFAPLYSFTGGADGVGPMPVILGPNGTLYGTAGGGLQNCNGKDCGLVFNLRPSPTACLTALCSWMENVLYRFNGGTDGWGPGDNLVFDHAGNLYGTTPNGGAYGYGTVYELTPSSGGWTEKVIYSFTGSDGAGPSSLLAGDDRNLYGTTYMGGHGGGVVFQLVPSGGNWTEQVIASLGGCSYYSGCSPFLVQENSGNLYGLDSYDRYLCEGHYCYWVNYGIIFMMSPSPNGSWQFNLIDDAYYHNLQDWDWGYDLFYDLAIDAAGKIYATEGTAECFCGDGYYEYTGDVFTPTPYGPHFLVSFGGDNFSNLTLDASGIIYGTTAGCGAYNKGTVWQLLPH